MDKCVNGWMDGWMDGLLYSWIGEGTNAGMDQMTD